jgi:hypothetical protein
MKKSRFFSVKPSDDPRMHKCAKSYSNIFETSALVEKLFRDDAGGEAMNWKKIFPLFFSKTRLTSHFVAYGTEFEGEVGGSRGGTA